MHWTLSFSVALQRFSFSSLGMVAFCVGCGDVRTNMFCQVCSYNTVIVCTRVRKKVRRTLSDWLKFGVCNNGHCLFSSLSLDRISWIM